MNSENFKKLISKTPSNWSKKAAGRIGKYVVPALTKSQLRETAIKILTYQGYEIWSQNNVRAVRGRTFTGRKGLPDIIGFKRSSGVFIGAEVKTRGDRLSSDQEDFLTRLKEAGGVAYLVIDKDGKTELIAY